MQHRPVTLTGTRLPLRASPTRLLERRFGTGPVRRTATNPNPISALVRVMRRAKRSDFSIKCVAPIRRKARNGKPRRVPANAQTTVPTPPGGGVAPAISTDEAPGGQRLLRDQGHKERRVRSSSAPHPESPLVVHSFRRRARQTQLHPVRGHSPNDLNL